MACSASDTAAASNWEGGGGAKKGATAWRDDTGPLSSPRPGAVLHEGDLRDGRQPEAHRLERQCTEHGSPERRGSPHPVVMPSAISSISCEAAWLYEHVRARRSAAQRATGVRREVKQAATRPYKAPRSPNMRLAAAARRYGVRGYARPEGRWRAAQKGVQKCRAGRGVPGTAFASPWGGARAVYTPARANQAQRHLTPV